MTLAQIPIEERIILLAMAEREGLVAPRELEVLRYWSEGCGFRLTARELGVSEWTVRTYRDRALAKLSEYLLKEAV